MTRKPQLGLFILAVALTGCTTHLSDNSTWVATPVWREPFDPPMQGKIQVFVSGNARRPGLHWIAERSSMVTVEEVSGAGDQGIVTTEPSFVLIYRDQGGRLVKLRYDLKRRTQVQKREIHLQHGDVIAFPTTCW